MKILEKLLNECSLTNCYLKDCAFCKHIFNCSCMEFSLRKTICTHIHFLGEILNYNLNSNSTTDITTTTATNHRIMNAYKCLPDI